MKKKLISMILMFVVMISIAPFTTLHVDAASNGAKVLVKTRTVTIKPGKTYTSPTFKLSKKMALQVPIKITHKGSYEGSKGYKLSLKKAKSKKAIDTCSRSLKDIHWYENWILFYYKDSKNNPGYPTGKYRFTIKNTTNITLKVKYSVKGYTKFASAADFADEINIDLNKTSEAYIGKIGPGIPCVEYVKLEDSDISLIWHVEHNGNTYFYLNADERKEVIHTTVTVKLIYRETPYKIKMNITPFYEEE